MNELTGQVGLVTGGAQGLGSAQVQMLARAGAHVIVADVDTPRAEALVSEVLAEGLSAEYVHLDVRSPTDWSRAVGIAKAPTGRLDVLVNNAGVTGAHVPEDPFDEDQWRAILDVNLDGVFRGCAAVVPLMAATGGGSIVNISSVVALAAMHSTALGYQVSKGALLSLSRAIAVRYAVDKVRCNAVLPGVMPPMRGGQVNAAASADIPLGTIGRPEDVASVVCFLASRDAEYVTGTQLAVDGGLLAQLSWQREVR